MNTIRAASWLLLLFAPLLASCESANAPAAATSTTRITPTEQAPSATPVSGTRSLTATSSPLPAVLSQTPPAVPVAAATAAHLLDLNSFCATTPARPLDSLSLPSLSPRTAVLLSVQQSKASCLVALDAEGNPALEFSVAARAEWKWDARARILSLRLEDRRLDDGNLLWNRPFEQSETQRLAQASGYGVDAFAFTPDGQQLAYLEASPLPNAIASWRLVRLNVATGQKQTLLTGNIYYLTPGATRPPADLLKFPVGWSLATNHIYLLGLSPGDSPPEGLWTIKPDGSEFRRLLPFDDLRSWVALSPDGHYLGYLAFDPLHPIEPRLADKMFWPPTNQVRVLNAQSGEVTSLFTETDGGVLRPPFLWAADSRSILLGHSPRGSAGIFTGELMNVPMDGSKPRVVRGFDDTRDGVSDMMTCPNGELLYRLVRRDETHQILASNLQGGTRVLLAYNPDRSAYVRVIGCFS